MICSPGRPQCDHLLSDRLRGFVTALQQRRGDRRIIRLGLLLVELEAALDLLDRHRQADDRLLHRLQRPAVILADVQGRFGDSQASNFALSVSICDESSSSDNFRTGPVRCTAW